MDFMHIKQGYTCIIYMKEICIPIHIKKIREKCFLRVFFKAVKSYILNCWCFSVVHANFVRTLVLYV